ncbi:ABC transporter substrate-binding protein [Nocardioides sp. KR10-350]|uniref:ABC transporter substrate-binding protein n=1 Tax=Nocardioides cheoyonin TaxID=3156615 RepID=UPI0032B4484F
MTKLKLTIATADGDRVRPIVDGRVQVEGCDVNYILNTPEELFARVAYGGAPEVSEIGLLTCLVGTSRGSFPYVPLPVFLSRTFRHSAIYIRTDRGIGSPEDLRGKVVGVPEWQMGAAMWARGLIVDEYGVKLDEMQWKQGGLIHPGRHEKYQTNFPDGFPIEAIGSEQTLDDMIRAGELDAIFTARTPPTYFDDEVPVRRLFENYPEEERAYYQRTGIYPIMHCLGVRADVHERYPWVAPALYKAYLHANRMSQESLFDTSSLKVSLPWVVEAAEEARALFGDDIWPYGVEANRVTLDALTRYSVDQHMAVRRVEPEELFPRSVLEEAKH